MRDQHGLTPKQARFVQEYLIDLNGTQAAIRAGYSKRTANEQAARLLAKDSVRAELGASQTKLAEKHEITLDRLTTMTLDAYDAAMVDGKKGADAGSAVKAVAQLSKMHGFDVGKRLNDRSPIEGLTAEQRDKIRSMVEQALERAAEPEVVG